MVRWRTVNFVGHAAVAWRARPEPGFVLGAMLPDFASMSRARVRAVRAGAVADGVDHHHEVDVRFHRSGAFRRLCADAHDRLAARGVRRGGARGAAHVGVELLLDGALVGDAAVREAYVAALEAPDAAIEWRTDDCAARWASLRDRLAAHGVPDEYADPAVVADRVIAILRRRPLLALNTREAAEVSRWLTDAQRHVWEAAGQLIRDAAG